MQFPQNATPIGSIGRCSHLRIVFSSFPPANLLLSSPLTLLQRASSTTAGTEPASSPFHLTLTASAATLVAIGSAAWYYHLYGQEAYAMTPAEEG